MSDNATSDVLSCNRADSNENRQVENRNVYIGENNNLISWSKGQRGIKATLTT